MQVRHRFPGIRTVVEHQPVTPRLQAEFVGHHRRLEQQMAEEGSVVRPGFRDTRDGFFGDDQHVGGTSLLHGR